MNKIVFIDLKNNKYVDTSKIIVRNLTQNEKKKYVKKAKRSIGG